jgi:predicted GNAT superfamily acetyltransferase
MQTKQEFSIRSLQTDSEFAAFESLQHEIWGNEIAEVVTAPLAKIVQKIGGISAGAFDGQNQLVGIVFGFTGIYQGKPVHWSHMLAVRENQRNSGLGLQLKLYQRQILLENGVQEVYWTFDPLVAKNAYINLALLGATVQEHVRDMYGSGEDSNLFRGIGTDRFIVRWPIGEERIAQMVDTGIRLDFSCFANSRLAVYSLKPSDGDAPPGAETELSDGRLRVEIPSDIHRMMSSSVSCAAEWRAKTRTAFENLLHRGYTISGFYRDGSSGRCFYCFESLAQGA